MADPPQRITLKEAGAPDLDLHGADEAAVLVFAFPFSLEGKAKEWFYTQPGQQIPQALINAPSQALRIEGPSRIYDVCACNTHYTDECPQLQEDTTLAVANPYTQRPNYNQRSYQHGGNQNKGWRDNSTQRWNQAFQAHLNQNAQVYYHQYPQGQPQYQQPPQSQPQGKYQHPHSRPSPLQVNQALPSNQPHMNDTIHTFMKEQQEFHKKQEAYMATIAEALSRLTLPPQTTQNTQQASTSSSLPSQHQPKPKGSINAITLRSGTKLDKNVAMPTKLSEETNNEEVGDEVEGMRYEDESVDKSEKEPPKVKEPKRKTLLEEPLPIPFPTLAKKAKKQEELVPNMVKVFKKVEVTVPLFQAIQQVPKYAKFLKDVCTHKDKLGNLNTKPVDDSISSLLPEKCNDPDPCLVTYLIGGIKFMDCMCDLGACVSIMPLSIYERLNLSPLKRSGARFVLADKSIVLVVGIAENVLVDIQGLLFPVDFHILETPPIDSNKPSSILLGRPFLKIARFKLDAHSGVYSFELDGKLVKFTLEESHKPVLEAYSIFGCDIIEDQVIEDGKE
ncbi:uncharacterized protein LOC107640875 [Arachis ipaensis]|uniref:uncharacterized protein LOC107640875 n=1 Tax=Arachis ipaensis TaxID=130454 RepID=UPI0007AF3B94|nr:uncharacterized protein LOC107640875 [Arachis ipaensis]XP_025652753.1 uncharacterized protein LOC112748725 [Arachis hypogaea]